MYQSGDRPARPARPGRARRRATTRCRTSPSPIPRSPASGMTEQQARDAGLTVRVGSTPARAVLARLHPRPRRPRPDQGRRGRRPRRARRRHRRRARPAARSSGSSPSPCTPRCRSTTLHDDDLRLPDLPPRHRDRAGGPVVSDRRATRAARAGRAAATGSTAPPRPVWSPSASCTCSSAGWPSSSPSATARAARRQPGRDASSSPQQPFGTALVWAVAVGMVLLVVWRGLEAAVGYRDEPTTPSGCASGSSRPARPSSTPSSPSAPFKVATGSGGSGRARARRHRLDHRQADGPARRPGARRRGRARRHRRRRRAAGRWPGASPTSSSSTARAAPATPGTAYRVLGRAGHVAKGIALGVVGGLFLYAAVTHEAEEVRRARPGAAHGARAAVRPGAARRDRARASRPTGCSASPGPATSTAERSPTAAVGPGRACRQGHHATCRTTTLPAPRRRRVVTPFSRRPHDRPPPHRPGETDATATSDRLYTPEELEAYARQQAAAPGPRRRRRPVRPTRSPTRSPARSGRPLPTRLRARPRPAPVGGPGRPRRAPGRPAPAPAGPVARTPRRVRRRRPAAGGTAGRAAPAPPAAPPACRRRPAALRARPPRRPAPPAAPPPSRRPPAERRRQPPGGRAPTSAGS